MYQAVYYDREEYKYYLRDDKRGWSKEFAYQGDRYVKDPEGDLKTIFGETVSKASKFKFNDAQFFENDIDADTRILVDQYYKSDDTPSYHNIIYFDIECEIVGALTPENIRDPKGKITSVAVYDNNKSKYYCLILDESKRIQPVKGDKEIIRYDNERELLNGFLDLWIKLDPTIVTGWNSVYFDVPYLYYRIKKILGEDVASYLSPINKVKKLSRKDRKTGNFVESVQLGGINHLDYMLLFQKYITKQEPSYRLGDIGLKYAKLDKIEYEGSLDRLFETDVEKFIDYNLRDVEIVVELENQLKFIELTVNICHLCHTPYETIYYSTVLNDGAILTYLKRKGIVSPNKPTTYNPNLNISNVIKGIRNSSLHPADQEIEIDKVLKTQEYAGGYLKEPNPGLYEWVIDLDFTSLYPSIIRSLNIGVETLVGRIVNKDKYDNQWSLKELKEMDPNELVAIEKLEKNYTVTEIKNVPVGKIVQQIERDDLLVSAPGVLFRKDKSSVVCEILADWFSKRVEYKNKMKQAFKSGDPVMGEFYNKRQHAYKIKLNDVYGVFAQNGWRYTDGHKMISKAITLTGQRLTQDSIKFVNNWLNEQIGTEDKDYIVTSDTDSLFAQVKDLILHRNPELADADRETIVAETLKVASEIQQLANDNLHKMAPELFNIKYPDEEHFFELKQEVVLERGYFSGKRRYAQFIVNKEGVPTEELDMKGLDLMKSNFPPLFKKFGEHILTEIMFGKPKSEIDKQVLDFRESLRTVEWKQILKPTGLKRLGQYIASKPGAGEIFSRLEKKCPINTKAAIYYNDILKFKKLDQKFPIFQVGDKMYIAYLKENPYRIDVIGFNGYNDPPEIMEFIEKYIDRDGLFDSVIKNKLENVYQDINWGMPIFNRKINNIFKF
jgi:DNA polymerase elongation subunit (family B)